MGILKNESSKKVVYAKTPVFKKVVFYCLPHELIITLLPFALVLIVLIIASFGLIKPAEFIAYNIAFPLALIAPIFICIKQISVLKAAFPRKKGDWHRVILSVFSTTLFSQLLLIVLFSLSCSLLGIFDMDFRAAAYIRDMFQSSPSAMIITYITVFFAYSLLSLMTTTAYFLGERTKHKYSFTISCLIFALMYVLLLIIFILAYFAATFTDIKSLEEIQVANSFLNSSILCSFVTFIFISIIMLPILYTINYRALTKL